MPFYTIPSTGDRESVGYGQNGSGQWVVEISYADADDRVGGDPVIVRVAFAEEEPAKNAAKGLAEQLKALGKADGYPRRHSQYTEANWARIGKTAAIINGWADAHKAAGAEVQIEKFN